VALCGIVLGTYLVISSRAFPSGMGSLPGPGFFPLLLGIFFILFSAMIAREAWSVIPQPSVASVPASSWKLPVVAALLVLVWLLSWGFAPFLLRTPLLVLALMRLSGSTWRSATLAAVLFTGALYAIFQLGLRVDLG
jgi:hypothetical protein